MSERRRKSKLVPRSEANNYEKGEKEKFVKMKTLTYSNMSKRKRVLSSQEDKLNIIEALKNEDTARKLADDYGVSASAISTIRSEYIRTLDDSEEGIRIRQSLLKKTNLLEIDEAVSNQDDNGPITFRVNIEVEAFDESNIQKNIKVEPIDCNDIDIIDESDVENTIQQDPTVNDTEETEININDPGSNEGNNKPDTLIVKRQDKDMLYTRCRTVMLNNGDIIVQESKTHTIMQCEINKKSVYDKLEKLSKMTLSVADQILLVEARNSWGRITYKLHTETKQECQIQLAINNWKNWVTISKIRDTPLMYKCYICSKAWWRLGPFREHTKMHEHENFCCYIENQLHECNMIACIGEKAPRREIPIELDCCWKCGNDYAFHKDSLELTKSTGYPYTCKYCNDKFYTCTALNHHYCFCLAYKKILVENKTDYGQLKFYSCHICKLTLTYKDDLQKHYINFHSVQSDLPLLLPVKVCMYCNQYHIHSGFHSCSKKKPKQWCMSCYKRFPSVVSKNLHTSANKGSIKCRICEARLNSKCEEVNHIVMHSKKFLLVYKCAQCEDNLFLMNSCSRRHHSNLWQAKYGKSKHFGEAVILPRNCIRSGMTEEEKSITTDKNTYKIITKTIKAYDSIVNKKSHNKKRKINRNIGTKSKGHGLSVKESHKDQIEIHSDNSQTEILIKNDNIDINNVKQEKVLNEDAINIAESTDKHGVAAIESVNKSICESVRIKVEKNIDDPQLFDEHNYAIDGKQEIDFECTNTNVNRPIKEEPSRYEDLLSKVFGSPLSFGTTIATIIKEEPIDEEIFEDDIIVLSENNNSSTSVVKTEDVDARDNQEDLNLETVDNQVDLVAETLDNQIDIQPDCIEGYDEDDTAGQSIEYSYNGTTLNLDDSEPGTLFIDLNREKSYSDSDAEQTEWLSQPSTSKKKNRTAQKYNCCCMSKNRKMYMQHLSNCLSQYECTKCENTYHSFGAYVWHFQTHGYAINTCPQCDISYPSTALLISHIKMHIKHAYKKESVLNSNINKSKMNVENKFVCVFCTMPVDFEFLFIHWESHMDINLIIKEVKEEDVEDREIVAGSLDTEVVRNIKKILLFKKGNLNNNERICIVCHREFNRKNDFKRHLIEHLLTDALSRHSLYSALKCQFCEHNLFKSDRFRKHMRDHACLPVYRCELCLKSFSDSSNFAKHKKTHDIGTTLMQCDVCKKKFHSKVMLVKHIKMHQNTKPIVCECCNKTYFDASAYRRHRRNIECNKAGKRFPCQICKIHFSSLKDKWDHLWEAHKQRKHIADCPICSKSFRKFLDVKSHIKTVHNKDVSLLRASIYKSLFGSPDGPKAQNMQNKEADEVVIVFDST